ncbi:uncharacterized protein BX663DRAFT_527698 [Cokeromyces recurvatus]|uniref:uncharacterized protein n=1 Tax=Cokeromyces recurvatus TaxID=90255 RepID=UPI00221F843F|nr:uncharacterized protein BX663DRAFT_527698 [Cokeromyces recurvatus]KAI7897615.1 hypothetical protein BX663DRAFT_527698 [Cokeromyces recurvatus]
MAISDSNNKKSNNNNYEVSATICFNCGTTTTPLWRRGPNGETICNACGLYLKARNTLRPPTMKRKVKNKQSNTNTTTTITTTTTTTTSSSSSSSLLTTENSIPSTENPPAGSCPGGGQCNGTGGSASCKGCPAYNQHQVNRHTLICANCRTTTTPLWRRDEMGNTICNACGLYYKLHNVHRPVSMKRSVIKRRKRIIITDKDGHSTEEEQDELESTSSSSDSSSNSSCVDDDDEEKVKQHIEKKRIKKREKKRKIKRKEERICQASTAPTSIMTTIAVPPIEDYIIPKRMTIKEQQKQEQQSSLVRSNSSHRLPPPPTTPPLNPTTLQSNTTTHLLPSLSTTLNHSNNTTTMTPDRPTTRFDPLFNYRRSSPLKEINLPPLTNNLNTINPYQDLHDFDEAMTRLERLRRRVPPEQSKVLSRLTDALEDIVNQAEVILSSTQYNKPSSSYLHHPNSQQQLHNPRL